MGLGGSKRNTERILHASGAAAVRSVIGFAERRRAGAQRLLVDGVGVRHVDVQAARIGQIFVVGFVDFEGGIADANGGVVGDSLRALAYAE